MPTSEARVTTVRASRYLVQLHRHVGGMRRLPLRPPSGHGAAVLPAVERVEWSETRGVIEFSWGRCTTEATDDALTLYAQAANAEDLRRIQDGIARRLETIGRRDGLTVTWHRPEAPHRAAEAGGTAEADSAPDAHGATDDGSASAEEPTAAPAAGRGSRRTRHLPTLAVAALAILVIAAHLGLLGGALAASPWSGWGVNLVAALVVLKAIGIGGHFLLPAGLSGLIRRHRSSQKN